MSTSNDAHSNKVHLQIGWLLISILLFIRIGIFGIIGTFMQPIWLSPMFEISTYLVTAIFIWWERNNLDEFHIDGIALIFILTLKPMETLILQYWKFDSLLTFPKPFSLIIWSISILLILSLILGKFKFPKIHLNIIVWLIIGFISGIFTVLLIGYPGSLGIEHSLLPYSFQQFISSLSPQLFFYQAGYAAVSEEPLFRGILWGYLRKMRISNYKILLIQAFLFMVGHIYRIKTDPISLFIVVPIGAIILGILAWRSKTIATSIVTHATVNTIGLGVFRLIATLRM